MNSDDRADLIFDLAEVLEEYETAYDPAVVQDAAIGYVKGRQS